MSRGSKGHCPRPEKSPLPGESRGPDGAALNRLDPGFRRGTQGLAAHAAKLALRHVEVEMVAVGCVEIGR